MWDAGNMNGDAILEDGEDDEEEMTRMERNLEKLKECLASVEDSIGSEKAGKKR